MTQETKKHPHDAVIRAWLDGKTIQVWVPRTEVWADVIRRYDEGTPAFLRSETWRTKPEDPDVWITLLAYDGDRNVMNLVDPDLVARADSVKMKLSEFKKIAKIED